jgi:alpha-1,6-mannosyltransferase
MTGKNKGGTTTGKIQGAPATPGNVILVLGAGLVLLQVLLAWVSPHLEQGAEPGLLILAPAALGVTAGVVYLLAVARVLRLPDSTRLLVFVLVAGALMRLVLFCSTPILEDDFHRYFWDGAVTAQGINPYVHAPEDFLTEPPSPHPAPPVLRRLAREAGETLARINHPHLTTIYPPVSQLAFALAYWLAPFSLTAWRLVLTAFDLATLALLFIILRTLNLPVLLLTIYWWNPLFLNEITNSAHLDVLALPFALGAVLLALKRRPLAALVPLAGGIGAKLWPLVLAPLILRPLFSQPRRLALGVLGLGTLLVLLFLPVLAAGGSEKAGLWVYARQWEMNDALFKGLQWGVLAVLGIFGSYAAVPVVTRILVLGLLTAWIFWQVRPPLQDGRDFCERALLLLAALFLLSPTQFPWYYVMIIPFVTLRPRWSLLLLTALLPLYYLRYFFLARGQAAWFDYGLVWLEYVPVWLLLIKEGLAPRRVT